MAIKGGQERLIEEFDELHLAQAIIHQAEQFAEIL